MWPLALRRVTSLMTVRGWVDSWIPLCGIRNGLSLVIKVTVLRDTGAREKSVFRQGLRPPGVQLGLDSRCILLAAKTRCILIALSLLRGGRRAERACLSGLPTGRGG
jgi:hypothetical protein